MKYTKLVKNYKGMWTTVVYEGDRLIATLEWSTKKGLQEKLKKMGASEQ